MAEKQYLVTRCDEESLQHSRSHKYIDRYYKNGRYNYVYDEKTGQASSTIQGTSAGQNKKEGVEGQTRWKLKSRYVGSQQKTAEFEVGAIDRFLKTDNPVAIWFKKSFAGKAYDEALSTYGPRIYRYLGEVHLMLRNAAATYDSMEEGPARDAFLEKRQNDMMDSLRTAIKKAKAAVEAGKRTRDNGI